MNEEIQALAFDQFKQCPQIVADPVGHEVYLTLQSVLKEAKGCEP